MRLILSFLPRVEKCPEAKAEFEKAMKSAQRILGPNSPSPCKSGSGGTCCRRYGRRCGGKTAGRAVLEDARFVLPNACDTKMIMTMNARSLMNFFELRCCERAQWEIRDVATQMLALVRKACPTLFKKCGSEMPERSCPERRCAAERPRK